MAMHTSWLQTDTHLERRNVRENKVACTIAPLPALDGYDVTTFFNATLMAESGQVRGSRKWSVSIGSNVFYFESEGNKKRFEAGPQAFLPAYGGFCAWSVAAEDNHVDWSTCAIKWPVPKMSAKKISEIIDGRLYLFLNEAARAAFLGQTQEYADLIGQRLAENPNLNFMSNLTTAQLVKKGDATWAKAIALAKCEGVSDDTYVRDCYGTLCNCGLS